MFEYIENWGLKKDINSGLYTFRNLTDKDNMSVPFEEVYEIPESYRSEFGDSIIAKIDERYGVYNFYELFYEAQLINLDSVELCLKLLSRDIRALTGTRFNSSGKKFTAFEEKNSRGENLYGVYGCSGRIIFEPVFSDLIVLGKESIAYQDFKEDYWLVQNLTTGEILINNITNVEKYQDNVISYEIGTFTGLHVLNVDSGKCYAGIFESVTEFIYANAETWECSTEDGWLCCNDMKGDWGHLRVDTMEFYQSSMYSEIARGFWFNDTETKTIYLIDARTGNKQVIPLPVAKSLGCPLINK